MILLDGPIGVGKTTLGRSMAGKFSGAFLDRDDFSDPSRLWYASTLSTSRSVFEAANLALTTSDLVFVACPLRCLEWIYFSRMFRGRRVATLFVGLQASIDAITSDERSRDLSASERRRSIEMIEQGYGARPFSDCFIRTDMGTEAEGIRLAFETLQRALPA